MGPSAVGDETASPLPPPSLNAAALLSAWEEATLLPPVARALKLLKVAWPDGDAVRWADVSVGRRDAGLLRLRESLFGSKLEAVEGCPNCGEKLELEFTTQDVRQPEAPKSTFFVEVDTFQIQGRPPTSADLLALQEGDESEGRSALLQRCILHASNAGQPVDALALPPHVIERVVEEMADADRQADVQVELTCPGCQHRWSVPFDILTYLWSEIGEWSERLLMEVHALAWSYGWSEADILAMSSRRRRAYLEVASR